MMIVQLHDDAIKALKKGQFIVIDLGEFYCKMQKYEIDEQVYDELYPYKIEFIADEKILEEYEKRRQK